MPSGRWASAPRPEPRSRTTSARSGSPHTSSARISAAGRRGAAGPDRRDRTPGAHLWASRPSPAGGQRRSGAGGRLPVVVTASRLNRADLAYQHLARAREIAERRGRRHDYNIEFGPTNVVLHEVTVAVELRDAGYTLGVGGEVDTSTLSGKRRARLGIDLARAHANGRRSMGPSRPAGGRVDHSRTERNHRIVRQVVSDLLTMQDPPSSDLRELIDRVGTERFASSSRSRSKLVRPLRCTWTSTGQRRARLTGGQREGVHARSGGLSTRRTGRTTCATAA